MKLSIVIPFYNEEVRICENVCDALVAEVNKITKAEFKLFSLMISSKDRYFWKCLQLQIAILV